MSQQIETRTAIGNILQIFTVDCLQWEELKFIIFLGHVLVGHVMGNAVVADEFECHLKCLGNNSCKSFNVLHKDYNNAKLGICELNNETRETKPGDFKRRKGSTYYGSVQVSHFRLENIFLLGRNSFLTCYLIEKREECRRSVFIVM